MSKKIQKYCDLGKAIAKKDKEFYQALDDFCMLGLLRPRREDNGVTFCFPQDKSYRKKIINLFYSKEPEKAVKMVKALILNDCYKNSADMGNATLVNKLNQMIDVSEATDKHAKLSNGAILTIDTEFTPMDYRSTIAMMLLKGEMPESGKMVPRDRDENNPSKKRTKIKKGGFFGCGCSCSNNHRSAIQNKIVSSYKQSGGKDKKSNIYVKKVYLQLKIIQQEDPQTISSGQILNYLGNEEVSDSYLLDMIMPEVLLCKLWQCLGADSGGIPSSLEEKQMYDSYLTLKNEVINSAYSRSSDISSVLIKNIDDQKYWLRDVKSPAEIRSALFDAYDNKQLLGRDLFIVYTNVMKELWMGEPDYATSMFDCYQYAVSKLYTSCNDMLNQELNSWKDLTLAGNLLKSDVFKYQPFVIGENNPYQSAGYPIKDYIPEPLSLGLFSMNTIMHNMHSKMVGGSSEDMLSKYL